MKGKNKISKRGIKALEMRVDTIEQNLPGWLRQRNKEFKAEAKVREAAQVEAVRLDNLKHSMGNRL